MISVGGSAAVCSAGVGGGGGEWAGRGRRGRAGAVSCSVNYDVAVEFLLPWNYEHRR